MGGLRQPPGRQCEPCRPKKSAHIPGDVGKSIEIDDSGVGAGAGEDHFGAMLSNQLRHLVIVDGAGFGLYPVVNEAVKFSLKTHRAAMREVASACQIHTQDGVAQL